MTSVFDRIKELGFTLPDPPKAVASYIPALRVGDLIYTSGVLPMVNGELAYTKEIGGFLNSVSYGYDAAKLCVLNALSIINDLSGLENLERIVKLTGYVHSAPGFTDQPKVINGASDTLIAIFGEEGRHVRSAIGVNELPLGASVELELIVKVKQGV